MLYKVLGFPAGVDHRNYRLCRGLAREGIGKNILTSFRKLGGGVLVLESHFERKIYLIKTQLILNLRNFFI